MNKPSEELVIKAIAEWYKPFYKPGDAMKLCRLRRTQFAKKCEELGIFKNSRGYFKGEDIWRIMSDEPSPIIEAAKKINPKSKKDS